MKLPAFSRKIITLLLTTYFRYVLLGIGLIVLLIGYQLLLKKQFVVVKQVGILALQEASDQLDNRKNYQARLINMLETYNRVTSDQTVKTKEILPVGPDINRLFLILRGIAEQSSMTLESIAVSKEAAAVSTPQPGESSASSTKTSGTIQSAQRTGATTRVMSVNYAVSGPNDYESYKRLLATIEHSLRLFDITSIRFSEPQQNEVQVPTQEQAQLNLINFELKTYYLEPSRS